jgi:hypothetical protein
MAAIVTGYCGDEWRDIAAITTPLMQKYAAQYGHSFTAYRYERPQRPPSWQKLLAISAQLENSDEVLWLDTDVVIVDGTVDIFNDIPAGKRQAMVRHATTEGDVPNAGVWYVSRPMLGTLMACAMDDKFLHHKWWEQAALLSRMGFVEDGGICRHDMDTSLYEDTHWLDESWNVWRGSPSTIQPRFKHACGVTHGRLKYIRGLANA